MGHDTGITGEKRVKRYSRHLGVATITGIILAVLIYHLQDYITPVIDSYDICKSNGILGVSSWLFQELILIATNFSIQELVITLAQILPLSSICFPADILYI